VGDSFWETLRNAMHSQFCEGRVVDGLVLAIEEAGRALSTHFPFEKSDSNELPDDIVFGK
jgi:uncharacterized membrane protein